MANSHLYNDIYVFGDSLSDTGRLFEVIGMPSAPYFKGHVSNGKLWVEWLAQELNLTYNPKTNFAWAGATTGTTNLWNEEFPDAELWGLQQQMENYHNNTSAADPNGLYIVWAGGNDFLGDIINPQKMITTTVTNLVTVVGKLRQHGVQHLVVINMPDLGKTPRGFASGKSQAMTQLTTAFNQALAEALQPFKVIQIDMPASLEMLTDSKTILDPVTFGQTNFTEACFDSEAQTVCETPFHHFYWDDIHPTTQGHLAIALVIYSAVTQPLYITFSDEMAQPILRLPIVISDKMVILGAKMVRDLDDTTFTFAVTRSALQTTKFQGIINFPNKPQYPTYNQSTGTLHLPIVYHAEQKTVDNPKLNFLSKFTLNLTFVSETPFNPFKMPFFRGFFPWVAE